AGLAGEAVWGSRVFVLGIREARAARQSRVAAEEVWSQAFARFHGLRETSPSNARHFSETRRIRPASCWRICAARRCNSDVAPAGVFQITAALFPSPAVRS